MAGETEHIPAPVSTDAPLAAAGSPPEPHPPVAPTDAPAAAAEIVAPAAPAPEAAVDAPIEKSLFSELDPKPDAAKVLEVKPPVDPAKPAEAEAAKPVVEEPAAPAELAPLAYEYKLPDTIRLDDPAREEVHKAFDEFRRDPSKGVQGLIDLHAKKMSEFAEQYQAHVSEQQHKVWNQTRRDWRTRAMSDPVFGGSGFETTKANVATVRDIAISQAPPERREAFKNELSEAMNITGFGDHPVLMEFGSYLSKFFKEPSIPKMAGSPPASQKRNLRAGFYKAKT